ncbi:MAG: hypothetical protein HRT89_22350 [Lentisphaeria bacterium]|nr:hypothetical protein [Lentisphaeria bacterium]NQZ70800.1 hypothetical protein [Lentisphaeria bacterium]
MQLYCYPVSEQSYQQVCWFCDKLELADPIPLNHTDLHKKLGSIIQDTTAKTLHSPRAGAKLVGIPDTLILFPEANQDIIGKMIMAFKKNNIWPILSVVTEQSSEMSLGLMIEHVIEDRLFENARKIKMAENA